MAVVPTNKFTHDNNEIKLMSGSSNFYTYMQLVLLQYSVEKFRYNIRKSTLNTYRYRIKVTHIYLRTCFILIRINILTLRQKQQIKIVQ